ncbi:hypothetical protein ACFWV1_32440 [Streptomyces sp. NPDC058700]|uniref:hypothetical protein n=1 Tax=unclassified Streptomyces TaxID=2593676 RepID=UPI00365C84B3
MRGMRKGVLGVALAAAVVMGTGAGAGASAGAGVSAGAGAGAVSPVVGPEADIAHHGHVSLWGGRIGVWLISENHGPSDLSQATVRLAFSEPMAGGQVLPEACLWSSDRVVSCRTGELRAVGGAGRLMLDLRASGLPDELTVDITTVWRDGVTDRNPGNDRHRVMVFATGDPYVF